jgi:hypothetical protein
LQSNWLWIFKRNRELAVQQRNHQRYINYLGLIDWLTLLVNCFVGLWILNVTNQDAPKHPEGVKMDVVFMITMTWPDQAFDDVDMHLLLPDGTAVGYNNKDHGYAVLDRDDLGAVSDAIPQPDGSTKIIEQNKEFISIRAVVPGRYVVNARVFAIHNDYKELVPKVKLPYEASFTLTSLNPSIRDEVTRKVQLTEQGKEVTAFAFTVTPDGKIVDIDTKSEFLFIEAANRGAGDNYPTPEPSQPPPAPPAEPPMLRDPRLPNLPPGKAT